MTFRDYRPRSIIRAAEITEEKMQLAPANVEDDGNSRSFVKGDYAELRDGVLLGWSKVAFEATYSQVHVRQQASAKGKPRKKAPGAQAPRAPEPGDD